MKKNALLAALAVSLAFNAYFWHKAEKYKFWLNLHRAYLNDCMRSGK